MRRQKSIVLHTAKYNVLQFTSLEDAKKVLPEELILKFINSAWSNVQMIKLADAMKTRR